MYIEECILISSILCCFGMIIRSRNVYAWSKTRAKKTHAAEYKLTNHYDYLWEIREKGIKSCIGYTTLITGMINYFISMVLCSQYVKYRKLVEENDLDALNCEVFGSWVIVSYCTLFQISLGSLACTCFISSFCLKACHALGFICPLITKTIKKGYWGLPQTFEHYEGEFNFDIEDYPITETQGPT